MEILEKFGINYVLLGAQIVNFLIILYVVKKFALKPLMEMIQKRKNTIETGLKDAQEAKLMLEKADEKEKAILRKARDEAKLLIDEANTQKEQLFAQSEAKMKLQSEKMIESAKEQITLETQKAQKELSSHVSKLAVELLEKSVKDLFSAKDQKAVMENAIKQFKKVN